jgi:hypothetical protein
LTPLLDPANAYPEVGFHIVRYCTEEVHRSQPPGAHADPVLHSEAHLSERRLQALLQEVFEELFSGLADFDTNS